MNLTAKLAAIYTVAAMGMPMIAAQSDPVDSKKTNIPLQPGQEQVFFRADQLVGKSAQTPLGQDLGKINEIVFNGDKGIYGVVKTKNDRLTALPWSLVTAVTDKAVVFNTSSQNMASAPTFTDKQWSMLNNPQFTQKIDSHFKNTAMGGSADESSQSSGAGSSSASTNGVLGSSTNESQGASSRLESGSGVSPVSGDSPTNSAAASDANASTNSAGSRSNQ